MTDSYLTLTTFVPGTKAKPDEVNANFSTLKDAIIAKAAMNGDATKTFSVADATSVNHATSKSQMDALSADLLAKINATGMRFCVKAGNTTSGNGDLFSYDVLRITPKIAGIYENLVFLDYKGAQTIISTTPATLSMSGKADGVYNIFIKPDGTLYTLSNKIYRQSTRPTLVAGDVWLNTSEFPFKCIKTDGTTDSEFLDIPLGKVTIASGAISSLVTSPFNQNGFDVNVNTFTQSLTGNGWVKLPNGLILQWGQNLASSGTNGATYSFPVAFPNAGLCIIPGGTVGAGSDAATGADMTSLSQFRIFRRSASATIYWYAIGY